MSEETHIEKIGEIIKDLSTQTTFSADAMRQFMELKDEAEQQERTIKYLRGENDKKADEIENHKKHIDHIEGQCQALNEELVGFRGRISELEDREKQCAINEVRMECAEARVDDHKNMVGLVFRNTEMRKRFTGEEMHYQPGCIEIRDEYGNIKQYAEQAGFVGVPVKKEEVEVEE